MPTITSQNLASLEPLNHEWVQKRLNEFPFVSIEGVTNTRTLGSYPIGKRGNNQFSEGMTRQKQLYRSAEISRITDKGSYISSNALYRLIASMLQERHSFES